MLIFSVVLIPIFFVVVVKIYFIKKQSCGFKAMSSLQSKETMLFKIVTVQINYIMSDLK